MDPFAVIPAFIAMTPNDSPAERTRMAKIACLVVAGVLLVFGFAGKWIFKFLGITMPAFQIAASIVLLLVALDMLRAQRSRVQETREETAAGTEKTDIAVTPLAIPMLSGPGAISTVILLQSEARTVLAQPGACAAASCWWRWRAMVILRMAAHGAKWLNPDCAAHRHAHHGAAAGGDCRAVHVERDQSGEGGNVWLNEESRILKTDHFMKFWTPTISKAAAMATTAALCVVVNSCAAKVPNATAPLKTPAAPAAPAAPAIRSVKAASTAKTAAVSTTLTEHLVEQLTSRTNGNSENFVGPVNDSFVFIGKPTLTTNFWLRDVTNILASSQGMIQYGHLYSYATYVTPISPRHVIGASHTGGQGLSDSVWLLPNGTLYTNTAVVLANGQPARQFIPGTDIVIALMQKTNPFFCKYLPDIKSKVPYFRDMNATKHPAPVFVRFHLGNAGGYHGHPGNTNYTHTSFISSAGGLGSFFSVPGTPTFGDYSKGDRWVGGDSGGPAFAIINNEAVLVCLAYTGGGGPAIANYTNQINAAMANLSTNNGAPVYTLTPYDLSGFPDE